MIFKTLRKRTGLSQKEFGQKIGVTGSAISEYETGKSTPTPDKLPIIARELGISVDALLKGTLSESALEVGITTTGNIGSVRADISEFYTQVPFLSARAQMGIPTLTYEDCSSQWIDETYPVFLPVITITNRHIIIEVVGDSMEPEIKSGALVLAESVASNDIQYESGAVYAVLYGTGRFVVKRIKTNEITTAGQLTLWSDNDRYGHITLRAHDVHCMWKITMKVAEAVR